MFEFIDKVVYINLDERQDRKKRVESELKKYFPSEKMQRFNAIKYKDAHKTNGYIGCARSHIAVLEMAIQQNWKNVLVVEDDAIWSNFEIGYPILEKLIKNRFDVITLGVTCAKYDKSNYKLLDGQSTTGYLINNHYYNTLIDNLKTGIEHLLYSDNHSKYALDQYWKILQAKDTWFCVVPSLLVQGPSYSDIEKKNVNYIKYFL